MEKKRKCKKCFEKFVGTETVCNTCKENHRCATCGFFTPKFQCDFCRLHMQEIKFTCSICFDPIKQTYERWKEHGNVCGKCIAKINKTVIIDEDTQTSVKGQKGDSSSPYNFLS